MKKLLLTLALVLTIGLSAGPAGSADNLLGHPHIDVETTEGSFRLELVTAQAPLSVRHFVELVDAGFYDGLIFHRVIGGFMIQGGGYTPGFDLKEDDQKLPNESGNAMSNIRGTIALARLGDPHSANSQFFINLGDNSRLDPQKSPVNGLWGYTVFGYVIAGMDVVDKIAMAETAPQGEHPNAPIIPIVIKSMKQVVDD